MANPFYYLWSSLFLFACVNSIHFNIPHFDPEATSIVYQGDAKPYSGYVKFRNVRYVSQVGRVSYAGNVPIWDSRTNQVADFTTRFSFIIDSLGKARYAAGLAFFLSPVGFEIPPNSAGGYLGLFNTTTSDSSRNQIVLVEFDTDSNSPWDPSGQHVGINTNSVSSAKYSPWNFSLHDGKTANAWISYNATTMNLSLTFSYESSQENVTLSHRVDLREILPEMVMVGFSAATNHLPERNQLLSWEFSSSLEINTTEGQNRRRTKMIVALVVLLSILMIVIGISFVFIRRWKKLKEEREERTNLISINDGLERGAGPRRFSYTDLVVATNNFSSQRKLGEGGFGAVYKGYFNDTDTTVAVKKISRGSRQGRKEYITEIKIISRLRHRNLVQLQGWCHDGGEFLLIYDFMSNGSLDNHLFSPKKAPINWPGRYKIARGLASALLYLHEEWEQCVVHSDIKSSNVMLDSSFNVKLGDFGLARLMDHELGPSTTGLAGTLGYMAPEYVRTGRASKASDVYSFGIVALEIATGRKTVDGVEENFPLGLVEWVWHLYGTQNLAAAVDERLVAEFDEQQIECVMIVGLWCAHPDSSLRPSIRQAIQVLDFDVALPILPSEMPVPTYQYHQSISPNTGSNIQPSITNSSLQYGR